MPSHARPADLVAVAVQGSVNGAFHAGVHCRGATEVTTPFLAQPFGQVARSALAVHGFAGRAEAKPLLGALVGLDFVSHWDSVIRGVWCSILQNAERRMIATRVAIRQGEFAPAASIGTNEARPNANSPGWTIQRRDSLILEPSVAGAGDRKKESPLQTANNRTKPAPTVFDQKERHLEGKPESRQADVGGGKRCRSGRASAAEAPLGGHAGNSAAWDIATARRRATRVTRLEAFDECFADHVGRRQIQGLPLIERHRIILLGEGRRLRLTA